MKRVRKTAETSSSRSAPETNPSSSIAPPAELSVVGLLAPGSRQDRPKARFAVVQQVEPPQTNPITGKIDWDVRIAPLKQSESDDEGTTYRLQIGASYVVHASDLVYPVDYTRGTRGSFIIYTSLDEVHECAYERM